MTILLALFLLLVIGAILWKAHQLSDDGNIIQGLKRYFDLNYQTDEQENKDIEHGLFLLSERLDLYHPQGWHIEFDQNQPGRPPYIRLSSNSASNAGVYRYDNPAELLDIHSKTEKR